MKNLVIGNTDILPLQGLSAKGAANLRKKIERNSVEGICYNLPLNIPNHGIQLIQRKRQLSTIRLNALRFAVQNRVQTAHTLLLRQRAALQQGK